MNKQNRWKMPNNNHNSYNTHINYAITCIEKQISSTANEKFHNNLPAQICRFFLYKLKIKYEWDATLRLFHT